VSWPANWQAMISGEACPMCVNPTPERDAYGVRIHSGRFTASYLQRAGVQRGYTVVKWAGDRHVTEPTDLSEEEAAGYWAEVLVVARALIAHYGPLKMNYETLGNTVPHLHTHLIPRYLQDPAPGRPFPLLPQTGAELPVSDEELSADADALRALLTQRLY
jgi:diadenosine tetraphosphate (Ap4A) HIT family hydrolase